jgi:hypothetical protein
MVLSRGNFHFGEVGPAQECFRSSAHISVYPVRVYGPVLGVSCLITHSAWSWQCGDRGSSHISSTTHRPDHAAAPAPVVTSRSRGHGAGCADRAASMTRESTGATAIPTRKSLGLKVTQSKRRNQPSWTRSTWTPSRYSMRARAVESGPSIHTSLDECGALCIPVLGAATRSLHHRQRHRRIY